MGERTIIIFGLISCLALVTSFFNLYFLREGQRNIIDIWKKMTNMMGWIGDSYKEKGDSFKLGYEQGYTTQWLIIQYCLKRLEVDGDILNSESIILGIQEKINNMPKDVIEKIIKGENI